MSKLPKVTVITVCFNIVDKIERTILSVINQTYPNIEYIVIDGASTDGTLCILRKYDYNITKWISESDTGIYNAMNKGWKLASGEWILFLGADDCLLPKGIESLISIIGSNKDCVYGDTISIYKNGKKKLVRCHNAQNDITRIPCCGNSMLIRKSLIQELGGFDETYKIIADSDLVQRAIIMGAKYAFTHEPITYFSLGGVSSLSFKNEIESYRKNKRNGVLRGYKSYFFLIKYILRKALSLAYRKINS